MQDPKKLRVWQLAHELSLEVIEALPVTKARKVPNLRSQATRAATSIVWNIAEGCGRSTRPQFLRHLDDALASANELESQLLTARDSEVISESLHAKLESKVILVRKMLLGLMKSLRRKIEEDEAAGRSDAVDSLRT